jgi:hypothetical protein
MYKEIEMNKRTVLIVVILMVACVLSAEDAQMLPAGTLQTSFTGTFSFASSQWNENWRLEDLGVFRYYAVNAGVAVEFGILNWLAVGLQWTPGFNIWSSFYQAPVPYDKATTIGPYDLYAAVKVQVLGSEALLPSETIRLTVSPLVKLPLFGRYFEDDYEKAVSDKIWMPGDPDRKALGVGGRAYFDYVLNRKLYLNLYGEFIYFLGTVEQKGLNWSNWLVGMTGAAPSADEVDYRFALTAEVEPHLELLSTDVLRMQVGLPVSYAMTPEVKFDGTALAESDTHSLMIGPNLTLQFVKPKVPLELNVRYALPLFGKNVDASNAIVVSVQNRFRIYGK